MDSIVVAKTGRVACGGSFSSCSSTHIPATLSLLRDTGRDSAIDPDHVAFSAFGVSRAARFGAEASHLPGEHAVLVYNAAKTFFSAAVVRCDTWAVQWAVARAGCLAEYHIDQVASLCANAVCGVASPHASSRDAGGQRVFLATRLDVSTTSKKDNKEWRQFLATPRLIKTGLEDEGIACIAPYDKNSFLLVTLQGTVALVRINVMALRSSPQEGGACAEVAALGVKLQHVTRSVKVVVHNDEVGSAYAAVYTPAGTTVQLVQISHSSKESGSATPLSTLTSFTTDVPVGTLSFAGSFHICVGATRAARNVQLFGLVPGSSGLDTMKFDVITAAHPPLGFHYDDAAERLVLLSSALGASAFAEARSPKRLSSLIAASLDFSAGPFSQDALEVAQWASLVNPFRHYGPPTQHAHAKHGDGDDNDEDVQILQDSTTARGAGRWTPLTLCYALTTNKGSRKVDTAIFCVETAPFLHTRLIKQWHNATAGLRAILGSVSVKSYGAVALPWNPRHVRRALRLLSQSELSTLLHTIAVAASASERVSSTVLYADATTAAADIALQIISLSRQMGADLHHDDVKSVAVLLRAARECGHELFRYASRMELLMESYLQRQAMYRVLRRRTASSASGADDAVTQGLEKNFYGISAELQTERTLHTRYTANAWAQHLAANSGAYRSEGQSALGLLQRVKTGAENTRAGALSDWKRSGMAPHQDPVLNEFERTLL